MLYEHTIHEVLDNFIRSTKNNDMILPYVDRVKIVLFMLSYPMGLGLRNRRTSISTRCKGTLKMITVVL